MDAFGIITIAVDLDGRQPMQSIGRRKSIGMYKEILTIKGYWKKWDGMS